MNISIVTGLMHGKVSGRDQVPKEDPKIPTSQLTYKVDLVPAFYFFMIRVKILILQSSHVQKLAS